MLVEESVINDETRKVLRGGLDNHFERVESGSDLDSAVREVLNDRGVFDYLAVNLREGEGLWLGSVAYWDDTSVYDHYGLTFNPIIPRGIKIFCFESLISEMDLAAQGLEGVKFVGVGGSDMPHKFSDVNASLYPKGMPSDMLWETFPSKKPRDEMEYSSGYPSAEEFCNQVNLSLQDFERHKICIPLRYEEAHT